ncbi:MAG TPA: 4'-phosphopantetheinyl transferase superfamily protein [Flavobacteriales bacterium]|nr:4'-phosphopantetheinyl transferase superfamily protein [Flavobacteriales bacterium]
MKRSQALVVHCEAPGFTEATSGHVPGSPLSVPLVWFSPLDALRDRLDRYITLLDMEERARADRFRFERDRERYILGHGLLREVLGWHLAQPAAQLVMPREEFGKPFLEGHPVHFNLSDTKDAVLVALHRLPIGADVETLNRRTDHEEVAGHYFTPREVASIAKASDGKRRFLELWTRKEAVLKACGVGLMDDLHSLEVGERENRMTISHPEFMRLAAPEYHVQTALIGTGHLASIACEEHFDRCILQKV